mmetsp:Transcript_21464/g.57207  ORF Transcript_21464/g.57207 Transcript_21464/m.57207 type:complete len:216 (+) Transcript_21464:747-1394(+)
MVPTLNILTWANGSHGLQSSGKLSIWRWRLSSPLLCLRGELHLKSFVNLCPSSVHGSPSTQTSSVWLRRSLNPGMDGTRVLPGRRLTTLAWTEVLTLRTPTTLLSNVQVGDRMRVSSLQMSSGTPYRWLIFCLSRMCSQPLPTESCFSSCVKTSLSVRDGSGTYSSSMTKRTEIPGKKTMRRSFLATFVRWTCRWNRFVSQASGQYSVGRRSVAR